MNWDANDCQSVGRPPLMCPGKKNPEFCSIIHKRSQSITEKITCKEEGLIFLSKTKSFLQSQNDQQVVAAPSRTSGFISLLIPCNQLPNICDILWGCRRPEAAFVIDHTARAKWQQKNMLNRLVPGAKATLQHFLSHFQLRLIRLSFVNTIPLRK